MALLSIDVLGPLQVCIDGKPVTAMESVKVRALLAYLAVESGRAHTRTSLVGLFWPDFTEESARHNLRQALFNLRQALGDLSSETPFIKVTRDEIEFNRQSDYNLDIEQFNRYFFTCEDDLPKCDEDCAAHASNLEEMVRLYRGEFLQQLTIYDSTEFEDWLLVQRESLHQRVLDAHAYLAHYYELNSDFQNMRRHASSQLELDPWREEAHRQLMRSLAMVGERSAALAQYETCRQVLAEELDVEPSMETRQLYEQIKRGDFEGKHPLPPILPDKPVSNLPSQPTAFVGREAELSQLGEYLRDPECRCLTLVGPGGMGKTRLALQAAGKFQGSFSAGAAFVPLASVGSIVGVVPAIMNAINISFYGQSDPKTYLLNSLRDREMLLILDNVEHLLIENNPQADISEFIVELLQHAPRVKLLVTTREALNIQEEYLYDVQGLVFPGANEPDGLVGYDAVTLFVQRARRTAPRFELNAQNQANVAQICRLVEGMPLAIELAATWMRLLSPAEIASEIKNNLDFLSSSVRNLPERHRSMRVVFDHSWQMLSREEQQVLCKLAIFRGGFQRRAAEQVAGATLSILSTLVNRTLLRRATAGRYDLHELVRQYSAGQLESELEIKRVTQERHYAYYLDFVRTAEHQLRGPNQLEWLERLELENDNIRAAMQWALESGRSGQGEAEQALELASSLRWFWRMHGHFREGCEWLNGALQQNPEGRTRARAAALLGMSLLINGLGDLGGALAPADASLEIFMELEDQPGLAEALLVAGLTFLWQGDSETGYSRLRESLAIYRRLEDRWGEAHALYRLGSYMSDYGGDPAGRELLEESAAILDELGDKYLQTSVLIALGIIDLSRGEYGSARQLLERALDTTRQIKHPWGIADALTNLGGLCRIQGDYPAAQAYLAEALDVYQKPASSIWQTDVYCALAENAIAEGDLAGARADLETAAAILGTSENKWLQVVVWYFRGLLAFYEGRLDEAARLLEEDLPFERQGQFKPDLARSLVTLGRVKIRMDETGQAGILIHEGLALFIQIGHKLGVVHALEALAEMHSALGESVQVVKLLAATRNERQVLGAPLPPVEHHTQEELLEHCLAGLGEPMYTGTWEAGLRTPFEQVVSEFLSTVG